MCTGRARSRLTWSSPHQRLEMGRKICACIACLSGLPPIARERITTSPLAGRRRGGDRYRTGDSQNTNHQECSPSPERHFALPIQSCDVLSTSLTHVRSGWFGCPLVPPGGTLQAIGGTLNWNGGRLVWGICPFDSGVG